jgi:hypothetical protein
VWVLGYLDWFFDDWWFFGHAGIVAVQSIPKNPTT